MKNKLKLLFAFLKGFRGEKISTIIAFEDDAIDDWNRNYEIPNKMGNIVFPDFINDTIEELVESQVDNFYRYLDFEYDTYWLLFVDIYPKKNEIIFRSEHKQITQIEKEFTYTTNQLTSTIHKTISDIQNGKTPETGYEEVNKISFYFTASYETGNLYDFEFDDQLLKVHDDDSYWIICHYLIGLSEGSYWNESYGAKGHIVIWDDDIFINYTTYDEDFASTGMNLKLTLKD